jgi:hypothetical protein
LILVFVVALGLGFLAFDGVTLVLDILFDTWLSVLTAGTNRAFVRKRAKLTLSWNR